MSSSKRHCLTATHPSRSCSKTALNLFQIDLGRRLVEIGYAIDAVTDFFNFCQFTVEPAMQIDRGVMVGVGRIATLRTREHFADGVEDRLPVVGRESRPKRPAFRAQLAGPMWSDLDDAKPGVHGKLLDPLDEIPRFQLQGGY